MRAILAPTLLVAAAAASLADTYPRQPGVDALHYVFDLTLTDDADVVEGEAVLELRFLHGGTTSVALDLIGPRDGKGMTVSSVRWGDAPARFEHRNDRLSVTLPGAPLAGERGKLTVRYRGTPASGLRIGANRHGDRTFFPRGRRSSFSPSPSVPMPTRSSRTCSPRASAAAWRRRPRSSTVRTW